MVQSATGLIERISVIAGVRVQPDHQTRALVDEQHAVARFFPFIVIELHR
jgi:hypothetical protein